jgi:hypothetical protein
MPAKKTVKKPVKKTAGCKKTPCGAKKKPAAKKKK